MDDRGGKFEPSETDPEKLARLLEIELMAKRAAWQQASSRRSTARAIAFLFLFLVIAGAIVGYFYLLSNSPAPRAQQENTPSAAATP